MPCDPKRLDANIAQSNNPQTAALASSPPYDYDPATESPSALARIQAPEPRAGAPTLGVKIDDVSMDAPDAAAKLLLETNPHSVVITLANLDDITDKFLYITIPQGLTVSEYPGMGGAPLPDYMQGYVTL
ncbi:MAG: hypothetical protein LBS72_04485, partial [Oscillospiraceae bacterium]|nr:hypothetical protein [Oscillospiraceae bacterium]